VLPVDLDALERVVAGLQGSIADDERGRDVEIGLAVSNPMLFVEGSLRTA
jgi:hypothetical protein